MYCIYRLNNLYLNVAKIGVISADVINSSQFEDSSLIQAVNQLQTLEQVFYQENDLLVSRGDSVQLMQRCWQKSFQSAIFLKAYFKRSTLPLKKSTKSASMDIRISLSVGRVKDIPENIGSTFETPFVISGRSLDVMKEKKQSFIITTELENINKELELECAFLQQIIDGWSVAQAEVIYYLVQDCKQKEIAEILKLTQPSVSNRIQLANWPLIQKMNERFLELMDAL